MFRDICALSALMALGWAIGALAPYALGVEATLLVLAALGILVAARGRRPHSKFEDGTSPRP